MERLKWITVLLISICHVSCFQTKPFNPIIGETFQCKIGSLSLYTEQTVNHPCTANFYGVDDEKRFTGTKASSSMSAKEPKSVNVLNC